MGLSAPRSGAPVPPRDRLQGDPSGDQAEGAAATAARRELDLDVEMRRGEELITSGEALNHRGTAGIIDRIERYEHRGVDHREAHELGAMKVEGSPGAIRPADQR